MSDLARVSRARIPLAALGVLGPLRARAGVSVSLEGEDAWVDWSPGDAAVLECVLPVSGAGLFFASQGEWFRPGSRLPVAAARLRDPVSLDRAIVPKAFVPELASGEPVRVRLRLERDDRVRPATALVLGLADLARWAESATTHALASVEAARSGERVVLRGRLPFVAAERFWGERVLRPLGWRTEPELAEAALVEALGLAPGEIALVREEGIDAIPLEAFAPLSRAAVRIEAGP